MGKKGDLSDFERGMVVGARWAGLSISKTADLLGLSRTDISRLYREWSERVPVSSSCVDENALLMSEENGQTGWRMTRGYNQGMRNTISERTTLLTLKQMGYSS